MDDSNYSGMERFLETLDENLDGKAKMTLKKVYCCMALTLLSAALGAAVHMVTDVFKMNIFIIFGAIGFLLFLYMTPRNETNNGRRLFYLLGFSFLGGLTSGQFVHKSVASTAFFSAAIIFVCFTLIAFKAKNRKGLYFGGSLLSLVCTMAWMKIFNLIFGSRLFLQLNLYTGLAFMCVFVIYDTQSILEKGSIDKVDHVWHPVNLLLTFLTIIRRLTIMLFFRPSKNQNENPDSCTEGADQSEKREMDELLAQVKSDMKEQACEIVSTMKGEVEALNDMVKGLQQETMELHKIAKVTVEKMDAMQQQQFRTKGFL